MRALEAAANAVGITYVDMMETAGRAVAERVKALFDELEIRDPRVAVLVGPGNNGGDGLVAARMIAFETTASVQVFLTRPRDDENLNRAREAKILIIDAPTDAERGYRVLRTMIANADIVIDALLGTGTRLPIRGEVEIVLRQVDKALRDRAADRPKPKLVTPSQPAPNGSSGPIVLAVDVPTGLDADSGELDAHTLYAHETITFEAAKPGLVAPGAADAIGTLHVAALNLPESFPLRDAIKLTLTDCGTVRDMLPARPASANKGTFGKALIVAGSGNYVGAPALAGQAAYTIGAGLVSIAMPASILPIVAAHQLETTYLPLPHDSGALTLEAAAIVAHEMTAYSALLIGPGLGQASTTADFLQALLQATNFPQLIVDADGLNLLAKIDTWWQCLPHGTILTPHAGEFARLAKIEGDGDRKAPEVAVAQRLTLAAEKAAVWGHIVVFKGAFTVIAHPDGRTAVLPFATSALARAGTGDVLAGAIVGLLAAGLAPFEAAITAGYLHGYAGVIAAERIGTSASVLASDVIVALPEAIAMVEQES
jgi:NAD(P)H-hydrate epimerase